MSQRSAGDPRRPNAVRKYVREVLDPEQMPPDYHALLSLIAGICGFVLKNKACAWIALFACMSSVANVKSAQIDVKQIACSFSFVVMGLFINYFGPTASQHEHARQAAST